MSAIRYTHIYIYTHIHIYTRAYIFTVFRVRILAWWIVEKRQEQWKIADRKYSIRHDWTLTSAREPTLSAPHRGSTRWCPTWAQTLLHFYHGRARTRYSDKHRLEMLKDRKNFNENPRPSAARPNVPFNSSSASVFFSFFSFFRFSVFRFFFFFASPLAVPTHPPTATSLPVSLPFSRPSLSPSFSPSRPLSLSPPFLLFLFHSLRFGPRAVRCGRTQKIYIC